MAETVKTEQEINEQIGKAFITLDAIYNLHAPADETVEVWMCKHCNVQWPCETEQLILDGLGLTSEASPSESE